jgi:hypothetical protein
MITLLFFIFKRGEDSRRNTKLRIRENTRELIKKKI